MAADIPPAGMLIIADDLSGAADCGIACTMAGLSTVVVLGETTQPPHADAIAVDADTRRKPIVEAAAETARVVRAYAAPGQILFKKLDSTLRGHIGAEIAATLATRRALHGAAVAVMAPAFPATGRTTVRGHQLLHGVRLEHTELWKGENIQGEAHIPAMLTASGLRTTAIHLDMVRNASKLHAALFQAARRHDVIACDAEIEADLQAIAQASLSLGRNTVWVGSAGLARYLPAAAGLQRDRRPEALSPIAERYCSWWAARRACRASRWRGWWQPRRSNSSPCRRPCCGLAPALRRRRCGLEHLAHGGGNRPGNRPGHGDPAGQRRTRGSCGRAAALPCIGGVGGTISPSGWGLGRHRR
jgi:hypothetical protein